MKTIRKYCPDCKVTKAASEFYVRSGIENPSHEGHYTAYCKECYKLRSKVNDKKKLPSYIPHVASELDAIEYLARHGVLATPGKTSAYPDVDLIAGMGVCVECKYAKQRGGKFTFDTTLAQQKRGLLAHVVLLICDWRSGKRTYHLFDAGEAFFYIDGRVKTGVTYVPGREKHVRDVKHSPILTERLMKEAEDRVELIDKWSKKISDQIRVGGAQAARPPQRGAFDGRIRDQVMQQMD